MTAQTIISDLKKSKYKFTLAGNIRSAINKLPEEEKLNLLLSLRAELQKNLDAEVIKPLKEVVWKYNT